MNSRTIQQFNNLYKKAKKLKLSNDLKKRVKYVSTTKEMLGLIFNCEDLYFKNEMRNMFSELMKDIYF